MNELANLAETLGADIELVRRGIGSDPRIGYHFLYPGTGYGGSCFPKDVKALISTAQEHGHSATLLNAVEVVNDAQKSVLIKKIEKQYGNDLTGKHFAMWGLAFKPNTDDMREAPSRVVIQALVERGATITAYDPVAMEEAGRVFELDFENKPAQRAAVTFATSADAALQGADALIILTEWSHFRSPDFSALKAVLKAPVIFDGRNLFDPALVRAEGFEYFAIGR